MQILCQKLVYFIFPGNFFSRHNVMNFVFISDNLTMPLVKMWFLIGFHERHTAVSLNFLQNEMKLTKMFSPLTMIPQWNNFH